jgi:hypothetical protein
MQPIFNYRASIVPLEVKNATIDRATQITAYLTISDLAINSLNATNVYVDGNSNVTLNPSFSVIADNEVRQFIITGDDVNWTDGNSHLIRFVASDGASVSAYVSYNLHRPA